MSVQVELEQLAQRIQEYGSEAFLVTVGADHRPHVVSAIVELRAGTVVAGAGRTTSANIAAQPAVTVLWPGGPGAEYSLIVDGAARVDDADGRSRMVLEPLRAVLHRRVAAPGDGPSCVTVLDQRA